MKVSISRQKKVVSPEEMGDCEIHDMPANTWGHIVYSNYHVDHVGRIVYASACKPRIITEVGSGIYWRSSDGPFPAFIARVKLLDVEEVILKVPDEE